MKVEELVSSLPLETQADLLKYLQKKLAKSGNSHGPSKDVKLTTAARLLALMDGLTLIDQKTILGFAIKMIDAASNRWR